VSLCRQVFNPLDVLCTRTIEIGFLRRYFHRQVNVAQPLDFGFEHAAEQNHSCYFAEEIVVAVDLPRSFVG